MTNLVVGSGPSGISCALALLKQGRKVVMVDPGIDLEPEILEKVESLQSKRPETWKQDELEVLKGNLKPHSAGVPLKLLFGSDFLYRKPLGFCTFEFNDVDSRSTFATGGFSNVWGASILPYHTNDLMDWPVQASDLQPHYDAIHEFLPTTGSEEDSLSKVFPFKTAATPFSQSTQIKNFFEKSGKHRSKLENEGVYIGQSRVALLPKSDSSKEGCVYCGLCLYGCPYSLIFNSKNVIRNLETNFPELFEYRKGILITRFEEKNDQVIAYGEDLTQKKVVKITAKNVFLGCGPFNTTHILLNSLNENSTELRMAYSEYFVFPFFQWKRSKNIFKENLNTLAQAFTEVADPKISKHFIHLQIYSYSDLFLKTFQNLLGPLFPVLRPLIRRFLQHFIIAQGYLHSNESSSIKIKWDRNSENGESRMVLTPIPNSAPKKAVRRLMRKLTSLTGLLGATPIPVLASVGPTGKGFHLGGTFPMRLKPTQQHECDSLGRPNGFQRVFVIDSTSFPSIPATTITYTVMANAHRIGSWVAEKNS